MNRKCMISLAAAATLFVQPVTGHALGIDDYEFAADDAARMYDVCDSRLSDECATAAAQTMCSYSGLMIRSRDEFNGRLPPGFIVKQLKEMATALADHVDVMEDLVAKGSLKNINDLSPAMKASYCRSVGATAWP